MKVLRVLPLLGLGVVLVLWLSPSGGLSTAFRGMKPSFGALSLVALAVAVALVVRRFQAVLQVMGHPIPFRTALAAVLAASPLAAIAPSKSNDLLRAHALRHEVPPLKTIASVVVERLVDVWSLCLLAAVGSLVTGRTALAALALAAAAALALLVAALVGAGRAVAPRFGRHQDKLERLLDASSLIVRKPFAVARIAMWSLAAWLANASILHLLGRAFDAQVTATDVLALWPLALFVGFLPVTLGGLGTRDAAFVLLLEASTSQPVNRGGVLAATVAYAVLSNGVLAVVGVPFMLAAWKKP